MTARAKPTVPELLPLLAAYDELHPDGGALHVYLHDYNVDDGHIEFCIQSAVKEEDWMGAYIGELLMRMSRTQRRKAAVVNMRGDDDG